MLILALKEKKNLKKSSSLSLFGNLFYNVKANVCGKFDNHSIKVAVDMALTFVICLESHELTLNCTPFSSYRCVLDLSKSDK